MGSLGRRLEALEEVVRRTAALELRQQLGAVSDQQIARWIFEFRSSTTCAFAPEVLYSQVLWERAVYGGERGVVPDEEIERRLSFIFEDVLGRRRHAINSHIKRMEGEAT